MIIYAWPKVPGRYRMMHKSKSIGYWELRPDGVLWQYKIGHPKHRMKALGWLGVPVEVK